MVSVRYRRLALAVCIGMLLVLLAGSLVTNTGSGRGCGDDWPLCNGKFIPAYTLESLIEYSHRLVTGFVGLLVAAVFFATLLRYRSHREAVFYASGIAFFTIVQALMGAAAVMWPQSSAVMALHFGFSLLAFAFTLMLVIWAYRNRSDAAAALTDRMTSRQIALPRTLYSWVWFAWAFCYIVVYLGAYVRHTDSAGGCFGWPLCNGELIPSLDGITGPVFAHRVAAALFLIVMIMLALLTRGAAGPGSGIARSAVWALGLTAAQIVSGALLVAALGNEDSYIFFIMLHSLIVCGLFGVLADMSFRSWNLRDRRKR